MSEKERLVGLCLKGLRTKGIEDQPHLKRLGTEILEIDAQNEFEYVLGLFDKKTRYPKNPNNLLVYYLLDIVPEFNSAEPPAYIMGEMPDCDVDYLKPVQVYLKNEWAKAEFGEEYVCNIGNYATFGIKSSLIDMAKVHGEDRNEILALTTRLGLKDEDGKALTFDTAIAQFPELAQYCQDHPDITDAARRLCHRNRGVGKHAGGLIISSKPIFDLVPLMRGKDGAMVSAWTEGLHDQDLGPVGLIKFDVLVVAALDQTNNCCRLVKERHGMDYICSLPGVNRDWSDISYLNDPEAIAMANRSDLKGVFQFDSDGIRKMVKGNVTSFDDLVAFSALYRPGPLGKKMHEMYIKRKAGKEKYDIHDILKPILGKTYGVMVFQEQIMKILHVVGKIPLKDCEVVRKAISKKKIDKILKYKEMFLENGQETLGYSKEQMEEFYSCVESFSGYGFNLSHSVAYTYITSRQAYLKAHYPVEFFCETLNTEKTTDKLKEYKMDAGRFGRSVAVLPVDPDRSKVTFSVSGEDIFYGLGDLKGVGVEVAQRVVDNQPYAGFEDFLRRFGTDAKVCNPVIGLNLFPGDRLTQFKYYEYFKDLKGKHQERIKRYAKARGEHLEKLRKALPFACEEGELGFEEEKIESLFSKAGDTSAQVEKCYKAYRKTCADYDKKIAEDVIPGFDGFDPEEVKFKKNGDEIARLCRSHISVAEKLHYGFLWHHPIEECEGFQGRTFERYRREVEEEDCICWAVDVAVDSSQEKPFKNGKGSLWVLWVTDAAGEQARVTVWKDDHERFFAELAPGNYISVRVRPPQPPFTNYTMESYPRYPRSKTPPKEDDHRVIVLKWKEEE